MSRAATLLLVLTLALSGCGGDPREEYCQAVEEHQQELSEVVGDGGPDSLLRALPLFGDLAEKAPDDLRDEWATVIGALEGLTEALDDAGVDPATYDRDSPPPGLSTEEQDRIDVAARELTDPQTVEALAGVEQHARDVCGTPLLV